MAVDPGLGSWFESLKKLRQVEEEDLPCRLPSRPWESIPSESGSTSFSHSSHSTPLYHTSTLSEESLVRLVINALQGVESALISIDKVCTVFCSDPADRTFHRIPSIWNRSLSTIALGRILKSIGRSGFLVFQLLRFVDYFTSMNLDRNSSGNQSSKPEEHQDCRTRVGGKRPMYSLVNQAFAVTVRKILEGYISALDTLYVSAGLRRSSKTGTLTSCTSSEEGFLTSVTHSGVTLLEVYLHTEELRTQIDAIGNICNIYDIDYCLSVSSFKEFSSKTKFCDFPVGGNLLTYLYTQLKVADPVHCALLKFLFLRSFEPYSEFIRLWIYKAKISDPYDEFIVDYVDNVVPFTVGRARSSCDFVSATIREQDKVTVPCFLQDILVPLFRAGQQLQVIIKLLELSDNVGSWDHVYEDFLPFWRALSSDFLSHSSPLTFNKGGIETVVHLRNNCYREMLEKLESVSMKSDFRYHQVVTHGNAPGFVSTNRSKLNIPVSLAMNEDSMISPSKVIENQHLDEGSLDSEASGRADEDSNGEDPLENSDTSSLASYQEQDQFDQPDQLAESPDNAVQLEEKYLSALSFSSGITVPTSSKSEPPSIVETDRETCEKKDLDSHFLHPDGRSIYESSLHLELEVSSLSQLSESQDPENRHDMYFSLGGLLRDPLCVGTGNLSDAWSHTSDCCLEMSNRKLEVQGEGVSHYSNMMLPGIDLEGNTSKARYPSGTYALSNVYSSQSWNVKYDSNVLSANPILTKHPFVHWTNVAGERSTTEFSKQLSSFDFTSVKDPFKVSLENLPSSPRHQFGTEHALIESASSATLEMSKEAHNCRAVPVNKAKSSYVVSPLRSTTDSRENVELTNVSGGSGWQSLLGTSCNDDHMSGRDYRTSLNGVLDIPLDFVIEKCLMEEILLQYKYVSKLTLKVLEEGFNLLEHLLALRRYHFMELADWADLFTMSLWRHKWSATEADRRISEIQGFLDSCIQRSSCERDIYKDRIYLYMKKEHKKSVSASTAGGIQSFDYLGLGYRVDWPVSIILTPDALEIYAKIFSFLIQVKLALSSLAEAWSSLKEIMHPINQNGGSNFHNSEVWHANVFIKLRQQVNHFVTTLQQYVQSQLSHVSWCKFVHSLKHEVKDMMDLESVHMSYLTDSLHICFLSDETRDVACIIQSILQCALDFRSCMMGNTWETGLNKANSVRNDSRIHISQVSTLKSIFIKNLKELYQWYLKSPRHGEFGLAQFWDYLNYNGYYTEFLSREMGHRVFSI